MELITDMKGACFKLIQNKKHYLHCKNPIQTDFSAGLWDFYTVEYYFLGKMLNHGSTAFGWSNDIILVNSYYGDFLPILWLCINWFPHCMSMWCIVIFKRELDKYLIGIKHCKVGRWNCKAVLLENQHGHDGPNSLLAHYNHSVKWQLNFKTLVFYVIKAFKIFFLIWVNKKLSSAVINHKSSIQNMPAQYKKFIHQFSNCNKHLHSAIAESWKCVSRSNITTEHCFTEIMLNIPYWQVHTFWRS